MASTPRQLWIDIETAVWQANNPPSTRRRPRRAQIPLISIRKSWDNMAIGPQNAIAPLLTNHQRCKDILTANSALPLAPGANASRAIRLDYLHRLRLFMRANVGMLQPLRLLIQERQLHDDPYGTVTWLQALRTRYRNQNNTLTPLYNTRWTALLGPTGTPPPSPGANAAVPGALPMAPAPDPSWVGGFPLGGGGQSVPGVYLRQNKFGKIIDRVCVKDTEWPDAQDLSFWDPDFQPNATSDNRNPSEIGALLSLNALDAGTESIIKLRNWHRVRRNGTLVSYRMYLEWCSYKDLFQLSRKYTPHRDRLGLPRPATAAEEDWIPEAFLWCCFENLAKAGKLMQSGSLNAVGSATWAQVIHEDLKPQNIFLADTNTSGIFAGYPQIKVGDFGLASMLSHDPTRVLAPGEYYGGTSKCQAPEEVDDTQMVSEKTNCWGIGVIMWGIMNSVGNAAPFYTENTPTNPRPASARFSNDHINKYSPQIMQLVLDCLNVNPAARPTYAQMLHTIRSNTNQAGPLPDRANGLRLAVATDARFHDDTHDLKLSAEFLPLYAALARVLDNAPAPVTTAAGPGPGVGGTAGHGPLPGGRIIAG